LLHPEIEMDTKPLLFVGNFFTDPGYNPGVSSGLADRLETSGWEVRRTSHKVGRLSRLLDIVFTMLIERNKFKIAVVDVYSGLGFLLVEVIVFVLRILRKRIVLVLRGGNLPAFSSRWPSRVERVLKPADKVVVPSEYLAQVFGYQKGKLHSIPNPIELVDYRFRTRIGMLGKIVWLRAFHQIYNPMLAIQVMRLLLLEFPDITLTMIGPDKGDGSLAEVKQATLNEGLEDKVLIMPGVPKDEVPGWLDKFGIFLNTTNIDNMPVSVLEAMACGLCSVSTDVGGIPYILLDNEDALLVPPNDPDAMTEAVRRILTDSELATRLSKNGRKKAEAYDWGRILPQWEELLTEMTDNE